MPIWLLLVAALAIIILSQPLLASHRISKLKKKIEENPLIGTRQPDNKYYYKERGITLGYRILEQPIGGKKVEWFSLRRRLLPIEKARLKVKNGISELFIYKKWIVLFQPFVLIVLGISLFIFYFGIKENSLKRIERFKWVIAQASGIKPDSIEYKGRGKFTVYGTKVSGDSTQDLVAVNFNPFGWLFFSDTARVERWSEDNNSYVTYSVSINDRNEVWLDKESGEFRGRIQGQRLIWDEPPGDKYKALGHLGTAEGGKLKIIDK